MTKKLKKKRELYEKALKKIDAELDIRNIARELQTLRFMRNIMLNKHQKAMIPHFKWNLVNYENAKVEEKRKENKKLDFLKNSLQQTI